MIVSQFSFKKMYSGFRSCTIIIKKIKPITSITPNTSITFLSCSYFQTILKREFIKRDFHKNITDYSLRRNVSKEEQDAIDNEQLQTLLKDSNYAKAYKVLQYEIEYFRQLDESLPQNIRPRDWIFLMKVPSKSQRRKYLKFLFINEMKGINTRERKKLMTEESLKEWKRKQESFASGLTYGLGKNSLFMRIYDKAIDHFYNYNLILSMLFEPKIVFDCGYEEEMTHFELSNCLKQIVISFVANRMHQSPAYLYLCNASENSEFMKGLHRLIPNLKEDCFPLDYTPKSYLDIFDKDKLVYLTPHCKTSMASYDPDKIYIVGAIVDKTDPKPYSLAKAKKEGLRMEKFPLDQYLHWSAGSGKNLTLNQVINILLDMKVKKDWPLVLKQNVPSRKLAKYDDKITLTKGT